MLRRCAPENSSRHVGTATRIGPAFLGFLVAALAPGPVYAAPAEHPTPALPRTSATAPSPGATNPQGALAVAPAIDPVDPAATPSPPTSLLSDEEPAIPELVGPAPLLLDPPPPPPRAGRGDSGKSIAFSDGESPPARLAERAKVKECCGYPLGKPKAFHLSFYWLAYESEYAHDRYDTDIYTSEGYWIGRYPRVFVMELKMEGSGILRDGRVLNYGGECPYGIGTCFKFLNERDHPLGRGVQGRALDPFRSVAVDPRLVPIGTPLYVPELAGLLLPDGSRHDGCVRADDQGGAIKQKKMDYFVESYANYKFLNDQLWRQEEITPMVEEPRCDYLRLGTMREKDNEQSDWAVLHNRKLRQATASRESHGKRVWWANISRHTQMDIRHATAKPHHVIEKGHTALARRGR